MTMPGGHGPWTVMRSYRRDASVTEQKLPKGTARRIFGFDHLIEVYKPAAQRLYGYYVLPFLRGDRIVGRADLKSERKEGRLVVRAFHREDGVRRSGALDDALDRALDRLARSIGLEEVRR